MADDKNVRHRFTVPAEDTLVNQWIEAQSNLGFSLRVLIKAFIRDQGIKDATCLELGQAVKKRGRPTNQQKLEMMNVGIENMIPPSKSISNDDIDTADDTVNEDVVMPMQDMHPPKRIQSSQPEPVSEPVASANIEEDDALASLLG